MYNAEYILQQHYLSRRHNKKQNVQKSQASPNYISTNHYSNKTPKTVQFTKCKHSWNASMRTRKTVRKYIRQTSETRNFIMITGTIDVRRHR